MSDHDEIRMVLARGVRGADRQASAALTGAGKFRIRGSTTICLCDESGLIAPVSA